MYGDRAVDLPRRDQVVTRLPATNSDRADGTQDRIDTDRADDSTDSDRADGTQDRIDTDRADDSTDPDRAYRTQNRIDERYAVQSDRVPDPADGAVSKIRRAA
jgi:hypothetical protein